MATLIALMFTVLTDDKGRTNGEEFIHDDQFLAETLGVSMILSMLWMFLKLIFKKIRR